jgi:hypothetical protein
VTAPDAVGELEPVPTVLAGMPEPAVFARALRDAIDQGAALVREQRGEVTQAEDTFPLQRMLAGSLEKCKDFENAFATGRQLLAQYQEEELILAVREQAGKPLAGIAIPDVRGDIRLSLDQKNTHHMDDEQLRSAIIGHLVGQGETGLAAVVTDVVNGDHPTIAPDGLENLLVEIVQSAMDVLTSCGSFKPQVTKVRAYAKDLARGGDDKLSAVVSGTIRTTSEYLGVSNKRKA